MIKSNQLVFNDITNHQSEIQDGMFDLAKTLFPICRSITGDGVRQTLKIIKNLVQKNAIISVPNEPLFSFISLLSGSYIKRWGRHPEHINFWNLRSFNNFLSQEFDSVNIKTVFPWLITICK